MASGSARPSYLALVQSPDNVRLSERMPIQEVMRELSLSGRQPRDITRMVAEARKHALGIEIAKIKTMVAESAIGDLTEHTALVFDGTAGRILDRKELPRLPEHQQAYDEFSTLLTQVVARDLIQIHTAGTASIRREVERPTYVEYQEPSWFDRLRGRE